jgi:hypothetical protein
MKRRLAQCGWLPVALVVAFTSSCDKSGPSIARVSGTVTHGGRPVSRIEVNFDPENGRPSVGRTDADGNYVLDYDRDRKGALIGVHRVWVKFVQRNPLDEANSEINDILQKYGDRKTTPLQVEVKEDGQVIPLELD